VLNSILVHYPIRQAPLPTTAEKADPRGTFMGELGSSAFRLQKTEEPKKVDSLRFHAEFPISSPKIYLIPSFYTQFGSD
jgi:hypothetical protein